MVLSYKERSQKLRAVSEAMGVDHPLTLLTTYLNEPNVPGICTNVGCNFIQSVPREEEYGYCPNLVRFSVQSILVLAGI